MLNAPQWARRQLPRRNQLSKILANSPDDAVTRQACRLADCMQHPSMRLKADGSPFLSLGRCRCRLCPICTPFKSRRTAARVADALRGVDQLRHIVLTLPMSDDPLGDQLDHLTASFRRLRQSRAWKNHCDGAIATIQVTLPEKTGRWHPHLHILADGQYFPHDALLAAWSRASKGAEHAYIECVNSRKAASDYVARYVAHPDEIHRWPIASIWEYANAMVGRRSLIAVGSLHHRNLPPKDVDPDEKGSTHACDMRLLSRAVRYRFTPALLFRAWSREHCRWAASILPSVGEVPDPPGVDVPGLANDDLVALLEDINAFDPNAPPAAVSRPPPPPPPPLLFAIQPLHGSD